MIIRLFFYSFGGLIDLGLHYFEAFLYKHSQWAKTEREEQRRRGRERRKERKSVLLRQSRQSRRTRREYEVAGALCFFCTNATSGIMRRRRLMCESRVLPCPQGSAEWQKGETREEGGHVLEGISHLLVKQKKGLTRVSPFCMFVKISLFRERRFRSRCSSFWLQRQSFRQALR